MVSTFVSVSRTNEHFGEETVRSSERPVGSHHSGNDFQPLLPQRPLYLLQKTIAEWCIALVLLVVTAPLMLILAILVKVTSRGPAIYAQTRLGRFGRTYRIYKLRTMIHNAEDQTGAVWAAKDDHRITAIGDFLRVTHLDELPQLFNILRGEMSLIGPRPERPEIAARIARHIPDFGKRLSVRPGVTGLAQMRLPADDPNDSAYHGLRKKLAHDLYYVRELSFILDLRIALCTPCYFVAAAVLALSRSLVRSHGRAVEESDLFPVDAEHAHERAA